MDQIKKYVLFCLKIEHLGVKEDLLSIGVRPSGFDKENGRLKQLVDAIAKMMTNRDCALRVIKSYVDGVGEDNVRLQHFGPMVMAYLPDRNADTVKSLYALAALNLPRILRKLGTQGRFVRGAFLRGYGWEIVEGGCHTLYGPVMQSAWEMMTTKAYSPRIIMAQDVFDVVSNRQSYGPGPDGDWLPLYARRDYDGQGIFDYLTHDVDSISVKHDGVDGVVTEMKTMLGVITFIITTFANAHSKYDASNSVRMSLALQDYVKNSIYNWTGESFCAIMEGAIAWRPNRQNEVRESNSAPG